jgi:hypothetical protein
MNTEEMKDIRESVTANLLDQFCEFADEVELSVYENQTLIGQNSINRLLLIADKERKLILNDEVISRINIILGVKSDLMILYPNQNLVGLIRQPSALHQNKSIIAMMLLSPSSDSLMEIRKPLLIKKMQLRT